MKKFRKLLVASLLVVLLVGIVGAGIFTYFGTLDTTIEVEKQAVTLDGHNFDNPVILNAKLIGSEVFKSRHAIQNNAPESVVISEWTSLPSGINLTFQYDNGSVFTFPVTIYGQDDMQFTTVYTADLNIAIGTYNITTYFSADEL